jgi:hypothetical protein
VRLRFEVGKNLAIIDEKPWRAASVSDHVQASSIEAMTTRADASAM